MTNGRPRRQCAHCPWKVSTDPHDIPDGYSTELHCDLSCTIAGPGSVRIGGSLSIMACHESKLGREQPCVGWLVHQIGPGNNITLRLLALSGRLDTNVRTVGPQHQRFEDTLPEDG